MVLVSVRTSDFPAELQVPPFPMQGSKRHQVPVINRLVPSGKPKIYEPFCGSAAVSIGAKAKGLVSDVHISDLNPSLMRLWHDILDDYDSLVCKYAKVWEGQFTGKGEVLPEYFSLVRSRFNNAEIDGNGDSADFLFLLNRIVKASLRYSRNGMMNQSADKRRAGAKPDTVRRRIGRTANLMAGTKTECRDWLCALSNATTNDVIYLDPPYQGTTATRDTRYFVGMNVNDFEAGISGLLERGLSAIISYDALVGPVIYGRSLDSSLDLLPIDIVTGVSSQGTLLGRSTEAHETLYLTPALVKRLGGKKAVFERFTATRLGYQGTLELAS